IVSIQERITSTKTAMIASFQAIYVSAYFFFQAEDGIRDRNVTGVQTCALPISVRQCYAACDWPREPAASLTSALPDQPEGDLERSEERRVGKEWRMQQTPSRQNKKHRRLSITRTQQQ